MKTTLKAHLMFRDRDFDLNARTCYGRDMLIADLELGRILEVMARGDKTIFSACGIAMFTPLMNVADIEYRQKTLEDARKNADAIRYLYALLVDLDTQRGAGWRAFSTTSITNIYRQALDILNMYLKTLTMLRQSADKSASGFTSEGLRALYAMLRTELNDEFFAEVERQLDELGETDEVLISATPGDMLFGINYTFRKKNKRGSWRHWSFAPSYTVDDKSPTKEIEMRDIDSRRDRALNEVAAAFAQSAKYLEGFFDMLRRELAFYIGCLNLEDALRSAGMNICAPSLRPVTSYDRAWNGLYDVSLVLTKKSSVTGNEMDVKSKSLYVITGANQGGKSTFLRSVGQAQLMAQCGMPVGADSASIPLRTGVFTHYKREEDSSMRSGKLDEELKRISEGVEFMGPGSMMLLNESFSSTNEREGSEICRQITQAFIENGVEVFSVSHMYMYATAFRDEKSALFLRAQRLDDGSRTFKLVPGEPLTTAYGEDLYEKIMES